MRQFSFIKLVANDFVDVSTFCNFRSPLSDLNYGEFTGSEIM
jgi:hypothetical protein